MLSYDGKFSGGNFKKDFEKDMAFNYKEHQLFIHMSKISSKQIQIVLASGKEYVDEINEIAKAIHISLNECKYIFPNLGY